jgi:hypothetical protein
MNTSSLGQIVYLSLLVRMWREANIEATATPGDWHSEVEHIQSGQQWKFETLNELVNFVYSLAHNPAMLPNLEDE